MKSLREVSRALRDEVERRGVRQVDLKAQAGIAGRTLTKVLGGNDDFKVSTLLTLADRLGLELVLVASSAAGAVAAGATSSAPRVRTLVEAATERHQGKNPGKPPRPSMPPLPPRSQPAPASPAKAPRAPKVPRR
jgi:hypothetical protein